MAGEDWHVANIGHVNVAHRKGLLRSLEYTSDIYDAWFRVAPKYWDRNFFHMVRSAKATWLHSCVIYSIKLLLKWRWS